MNLQKILVPFDLREDSYSALNHAAFFANHSAGEIVILHLIKNAQDKAEAERKLQPFLQKLSAEFQGKVSSIIEVGNIFKDVSEIAQREECQLIIIPTHGIKGMQHIMGSNALRIVTDAFIPFLVVQERMIRANGLKKIVIPVSARRQIIDEAPLFAEISKAFNSEVHLFANTHLHEQYNDSILTTLEDFLEKEGANVKVHRVSLNERFAKSVTHFAASIDADLICAVNFSYDYLYSLFPRVEEEDLIYNEAQIPVLMITPEQREDLMYYFPLLH